MSNNTLNAIYNKLNNVYLTKRDIQQSISDKIGYEVGENMDVWSDTIIDSNYDNVCVQFFDYDGVLLHTYKLGELKKNGLPSHPSQPGLICQGWNYTLEDIVGQRNPVNVGATYITDDDKTRLYINLLNDGTPIPLRINQTVSDGVTVEWGDGNSETISGTGNVIFNHVYNETGFYTITLTVNSGTCTLGHNSPSYNVMGTKGTIASGSLYKVEIGSNTKIGKYTFQYCYKLQSIAIPNSAITIGNHAFRECYGLQSITIPNSVTEIGNNAFSSCYNLQSIAIPNSVTSISSYTFQYCYGLQSITIPNSVTSIGTYAFDSCYSLQSVTISNSVTAIGNYTFQYCYGLQSVTIPDSVTKIGSNTFYECCNLQSVTIPDSVTNINSSTFYSCSSLQSITIPNSVTAIGEEAFRYCYGLQSITIPNSVQIINSSAFSNCYSMQYYDFTSHTSVPTLSNTNAFTSIASGCEIRVPAVLYEEWINATNWSSYADYIVMDTDITEYTSLTIAADDVSGRKTNTTIYWEVVANGVNKYTGEIVTGIRLNGTDVSDEFDQNTSTTDTVTRTITYTKYGLTAATTITQGVWEDPSYTIDLNSNWQLSSTIANPDSSLYDGVYESFSNKGVNNTAAIMYIDIKGYTDFNLYIRSYAESSHDYVMVSQLDQTINNSTTYSDTTLVKAHTRSSQTSGTAISDYKLVEFTGIDEGEHRITIVYRKDSSGAGGDDQGYLIIPK